MSNPAIKVELGFDTALTGVAFTLDDATKGLLSNTVNSRTNLVQNSTFNSSTAGWYVGANCTLSVSSAQAYSGTTSMAMTATTSGNASAALGSNPLVTVGQTYFASAYFLANATSRSVSINIDWYNAANTYLSTSTGSTVSDSTTDWVRAFVTGVAPATADHAQLVVKVAGVTTSETHYVDAVMLEAATSLGAYFDGSSAPSGDYIYVWSGSAFNSSSIATLPDTSSIYTLSGIAYRDVTQYAGQLSINRGKSRELDRYQAGHATVVFSNLNRYFDPTFTSSPFYGQIVPRRSIRISVKGIVTFLGVVDDWNLDYNTNGTSTATVSAYDALSMLSQQNLTAASYPAELTGARIARVLNSASVNYDLSLRKLDVGQATVQAQTVDSTVGALDYLAQVETTEHGSFFVDKTGNAVFLDSADAVGSDAVIAFSDDGVGISYQGMRVVYGSELLYNSAAITRLGGVTQTANNTTSQQTYNIRQVTQDTLHSTDAEALRLANYLVNLYGNPEFRFESVDVSMGDATDYEQSTVLQLEIGSMCQVTFTPNRIAPAIVKYAKVIGIDHNADPDQHIVTLRFETVDYQLMILDDAVFGLLDSYYLGI